MTPDQLAKTDSEHGHQTAFFAYLAVARKYGFNVADDWAAGMGIEAALSSRCNDMKPVPELEWIHAIPNGGARGDTSLTAMKRGAKLKAEGVRPGIPDVFWPLPKRVPRSTPRMGTCKDMELFFYCGLYIEMKPPNKRPVNEGGKGGCSDKQLEFKAYALDNGYGWSVCYGWREAVHCVRTYLDWLPL